MFKSSRSSTQQRQAQFKQYQLIFRNKSRESSQLRSVEHKNRPTPKIYSTFDETPDTSQMKRQSISTISKGLDEEQSGLNKTFRVINADTSRMQETNRQNKIKDYPPYRNSHLPDALFHGNQNLKKKLMSQSNLLNPRMSQDATLDSKMKQSRLADRKTKGGFNYQDEGGSRFLRKISYVQDENGKIQMQQKKVLQSLAEEIVNRKDKSIDLLHRLKNSKSELDICGDNKKKGFSQTNTFNKQTVIRARHPSISHHIIIKDQTLSKAQNMFQYDRKQSCIFKSSDKLQPLLRTQNNSSKFLAVSRTQKQFDIQDTNLIYQQFNDRVRRTARQEQ